MVAECNSNWARILADVTLEEGHAASAVIYADLRRSSLADWPDRWHFIEQTQPATLLTTYRWIQASKLAITHFETTERVMEVNENLAEETLISFDKLQIAFGHGLKLTQQLGNLGQIATKIGAAFADVYDDAVLSQLRERYEIRDQQARRFLSANLDLIPVLIELADMIPAYFGDEYRPALEAIHDPDDNQGETLFAVIRTSLAPEEALENLRTFDKDWWFEWLRITGGRFTVTLEYV